MESSIPKAITISSADPAIPTIPMIVRALLRATSLKFHFTAKDRRDIRPLGFSLFFFCLILGTSRRRVCAAGSQRILRLEKYVTSVTISTISTAQI